MLSQRKHTNHTRSEIKVFADNFDQLLITLGSRSVRVDEDGKRLSNTDGIGELNKSTLSKPCGDQGLG